MIDSTYHITVFRHLLRGRDQNGLNNCQRDAAPRHFLLNVLGEFGIHRVEGSVIATSSGVSVWPVELGLESLADGVPGGVLVN